MESELDDFFLISELVLPVGVTSKPLEDCEGECFQVVLERQTDRESYFKHGS